jgi:hypothetical protein
MAETNKLRLGKRNYIAFFRSTDYGGIHYLPGDGPIVNAEEALEIIATGLGELTEPDDVRHSRNRRKNEN